MKLGIVGSRSFNNYPLLQQKLSIFNKESSKIESIISGGAYGAEKYANDNGIEMVVYKPEWNKYGNSAGYIRNKKIVSESDYIIAFWDGTSKGTKLSIDLCDKYNKPITIIYI